VTRRDALPSGNRTAAGTVAHARGDLDSTSSSVSGRPRFSPDRGPIGGRVSEMVRRDGQSAARQMSRAGRKILAVRRAKPV
jgi:hypothetical protein